MTLDLEPFLERADSVLDPARSREVYARQRNACRFGEPGTLPIAFVVDDLPGWKRFRIDEAFGNPDLMLANELRSVYGSALVGDDRIGTLRANFGVGILPSLFGCAIRLTFDAMPWVESFDSRDAIKKIVANGVPDLRGGLWPKVDEFQNYALSRIKDYPSLHSSVRLSMCDMQGPFSIAHLVWGNDIYYAVVDEPSLVSDFLEVVTETYVQFIRQEREATSADEDFTEFLNVLVPGKVLIREDSATNLSPAMYKRYCLPYIQKTLNVFPGGVHYCGAGHQFFDLVTACDNLTCVNFGNPELQYPEKVKALIDRRIAVIGWGVWPLDPLLASERTGLTLGVPVPGVEEGTRILAQRDSCGRRTDN